MADGRMYAGGQREKAGFLLGFDGLQSALILVAALCALLPLSTKSLAVLAVTGPIGIVLAIGALVRVEGKVGARWAMFALANAANAGRGANRFRSRPVSTAVNENGEAQEDHRMDLPGVLTPVRLVASIDGDRTRFSAVNHRLNNTYTAVAQVTSQAAPLQGATALDRRVSSFGGWMSQLCSETGVISGVGIYHTVEMSDGDELRGWNEERIDPGAVAAAADNLRSLFVSGRRKVADHVSYLALTIDAGRNKREIRNAGGGNIGAMAVLLRQMAAVSGSIRGSGVEVERWLDHDQLAGVIRSAFAPYERRAISQAALRARAKGERDPGVPPALAGPTSTATKWGVYAHDDSWSVTGEIVWPRTPRDATLLSGLLAASDKGRRHVALLYEPISPRAAERALTSDKTRRQAVLGMRAKTGQAAPERERKELAVATAQDRDLAAGHGLLRYCAYVSVTVTNFDDLEPA